MATLNNLHISTSSGCHIVKCHKKYKKNELECRFVIQDKMRGTLVKIVIKGGGGGVGSNHVSWK